MKRSIFSILCVSAFFIGIGSLADKAGASLKSDEKALELIRQARLAIGGDQAIAAIRSMTISGKTSHTIVINGTQRTDRGDEEIALQLPDKFMRSIKIARQDGTAGEKALIEQSNIIVFSKADDQKVMVEGGDAVAGPDGKKVIVRKLEGPDGAAKFAIEGKEGEFTTPDGKKIVVRNIDGDAASGEHKIIVRKGAEGETATTDREARVFERRIKSAHEGMRQNELARTTLALLLSAPEGVDVTYTYAGEGDVDGSSCNIVNADLSGSSVKLYLSKVSSLPVMIAYTAEKLPVMFHLKTKAPDGAETPKDNVMFVRTEGPAPEKAEYQVRFTDYRSVGEVQLPFKWTTSAGGQTTETFDVTAYNLNPANIAQKFQQKVMVRTKKEAQN